MRHRISQILPGIQLNDMRLGTLMKLVKIYLFVLQLEKYFFIFSRNIYFQLSLYSSFKALLQMLKLVVVVVVVADDISFLLFYIF
jgi:hypothetical protein